MKISVVFILFVLFISCNQNQAPKAVADQDNSILSDNSENQTTKIKMNTPSSNIINESKAIMSINKGIIGTYLGKNGDKDFELNISKVFGESIEGYCITGSKKKPVKGKIVNKATEPSVKGDVITIYRLILSEPGNTKLNGEYIISLAISKAGISGEGNWRSYNRKLESYITITKRQIK